jgi:glycosyltransferase involved in cell wall biosynthesis
MATSKAKSVLCVQPVAERGGSDQALLALVGQLARAGWDVRVALPAAPQLDYAATGAKVHVVPMRRISTSHGPWQWAAYAASWPTAVLKLWRLARAVDLVHSNSLHCWYGWAAALLAGRPHIWHAREIVTQSRAALAVERFLTRHFATCVVAVSQAVASQLAGANVCVAYEEADSSVFCPARAGQARQRYGLPDTAPTVGYVGRIDTWKGVEVFLEAFALLRERRREVRGVVAGSPVAGKEAFASRLSARAAEVGVAWLGALTGPEVADLLADLDCLACPSTAPEPWGLSAVEALASGTPVVASDAGGLREVMAGLPPAAGRLVAPGSAPALATAIDEVLPPTTSAGLRQLRAPLRRGGPPPYPEMFERASLRQCPRSLSPRP